MSNKKEYDNFIKKLNKIKNNPKYIQDYIDKFGEEPFIIGIYWNDQKTLEENIKNAIKSGKKYNELDLLTEKQKESYLKGDLLF